MIASAAELHSHVNEAVNRSGKGREAFLESLAGEYGTPFYLYDAEAIERQVKALSRLLPEAADSQLLFSFKSNPNPSVAGEMRRGGCRPDLTSPGEIAAAKEAGFDLAEGLFGGPGKSAGEYSLAITEGMRHFSIESARDLAALGEAATAAGTGVRALLRINPEEPPRAKLAMSGVASQFGFEEAELRSAGPALIEPSGEFVDVVGVHIYWGTQVGDAEALMACFESTVRIAEEISSRLEFPLEILNLGGGFPWPYAKNGEEPDLDGLKSGLRELHAGAGSARDARWWFESGRYLCAPSGSLVTRVMETKTSKDKKFLILDTGIHHLGGMAGLGRIPRFSIDLEVPSHRAGNEEVTVDVVGQLCTPLDCIGRRISLPAVEPGDLLEIPNTGAYGPTASVSGFLSRPAPAEIVHRGGEIRSAHRLRSGHEPIL
jgi:diaminopimelate decarboxylase